MVFGVVTIVKKKPVVQFMVGAYAPRDRLVGIAPVMEEIAVQVRATMPQIIERQKEEPKFPV
jgi:predicted component of type VI protein secretion system